MNLYAVWNIADRLSTEETIRAWTQTEAVTVFAAQHANVAQQRILCRCLGWA